MKETKKLSELIPHFIDRIVKETNLKIECSDVHNIWKDLIKEENLPLDSTLEDIDGSAIIIHVNHPGSAQQIRMKEKIIIQAFNKRSSIFNIKYIKVLIDMFHNS